MTISTPCRAKRRCLDWSAPHSGQKVDHSGSRIQALFELFCSSELCDVQLQVGQRLFHAHKLILSLSSDVLKTMLTDTKWPDAHKTRILLSEEPECVQVFGEFLQYMYTGVVELTTGTVLALLTLADKYNLRELAWECKTYMASHCHADLPHLRVVSWLQYAMLCGDRELEASTRRYVELNFNHVMSSQDFLTMRHDTLDQLLTCPHLVIHSEFALFTCLKDWFIHNIGSSVLCDHDGRISPDPLRRRQGNVERERERQVFLSVERERQTFLSLMAHVRFPTMKAAQLLAVHADPLFQFYTSGLMSPASLSSSMPLLKPCSHYPPMHNISLWHSPCGLVMADDDDDDDDDSDWLVRAQRLSHHLHLSPPDCSSRDPSSSSFTLSSSPYSSSLSVSSSSCGSSINTSPSCSRLSSTPHSSSSDSRALCSTKRKGSSEGYISPLSAAGQTSSVSVWSQPRHPQHTRIGSLSGRLSPLMGMLGAAGACVGGGRPYNNCWPRNYTCDDWSVCLTIEEFSTFPSYNSQAYFFSTPASAIPGGVGGSLLADSSRRDRDSPGGVHEDDSDTSQLEWQAELYPRGVRFPGARMICIPESYDIEESCRDTVRLALSSKSCHAAKPCKVEVNVLALARGLADGTEYVQALTRRDFIFDQDHTVLNLDDIVPFWQLNCQRSTYLTDSVLFPGKQQSCFKLVLIIKPVSS